jgi:hypothetical protein
MPLTYELKSKNSLVANRSPISSTSTIASSSTVKQNDLKIHKKNQIDYDDDEERDSGINLNTNSLNKKANHQSLTNALTTNKMISRKLKLNNSDFDDDEFDMYDNSATEHSSNTMPRYLKNTNYNNYQHHYPVNVELDQRLLPTSKNRIYTKSSENQTSNIGKEEKFKCK